MRCTPIKNPPLKSEDELLYRCAQIEGMTFAQLSGQLQRLIPAKPQQRKGWLGQSLELFLGADAGTRAEPDFKALGVELKTIPINLAGAPAESTYVTSIPLLTIHQQQWLSSQCYAKLKRVLWVPVEGDKAIPYAQRRIGRAFLWSPNEKQSFVLEQDWNFLTTQIATGQLESINASAGSYLHIRPKGANARDLCYGYDEQGNKSLTLPRGFYLRSTFTHSIL